MTSLLIQLPVIHPKLMEIWVHIRLLYPVLSRAWGQVLGWREVRRETNKAFKTVPQAGRL